MASSSFNVAKNNLEGAVYEGDLDNVTTGGAYSITGSGVTNAPTEMTGTGSLMVINGPVLTHQVIFLGNSIIYMRRRAYGLWSGWTKTTLTPVT